jgi:hypothetical protein
VIVPASAATAAAARNARGKRYLTRNPSKVERCDSQRQPNRQNGERFVSHFENNDYKLVFALMDRG